MTKKIVAILVLLICVPIMTFATSSSELENRRNELQNSINEAENRHNEVQTNINTTKSELDSLNEQIGKKQYEVDQITLELETLTAEVEKLTGELNEAQEKYDHQYDMLCKRIVAQYKRGKVSYLDVLLGSNSLSDFISNYYIVSKIAEYDTQLLEDIEEQRQYIEKAKIEVEAKQSQVAEKQAQLKLEQTILTNTKINKDKLLSQLTDEERELQRIIDEANEQLRQTEEEIRRLAAQNGNGGNYSGGELEWPCPNYTRISSYFGYRGSAATGGVGTANHNGYDLAAPHYVDVISAESGTVIKVVNACTHDYPKTAKTKCNCGGGYGNYIMIDHGGQLVTLYGHLAKINVSVGEKVYRGQKIGEVGSCGWSTGYHLHFSVIANGKYVDPGNYFNR